MFSEATMVWAPFSLVIVGSLLAKKNNAQLLILEIMGFLPKLTPTD